METAAAGPGGGSGNWGKTEEMGNKTWKKAGYETSWQCGDDSANGTPLKMHVHMKM